MAQQDGRSPSAEAGIAPVVRGLLVAGVELQPSDAVQSTADRLAELAALAAGAPSAMLHVAEGSCMRLVGGHALPEGFVRMDAVPASSTLAGLVVHYGFAVVVEDVASDARVPPHAPVRAVGIGSYAGFPIRDPAGEVVGVCAVMDYQPRRWRPAQLDAVDKAAQACTALIGQRYARRQVDQQRSFLTTLLDSLDTGVIACDLAGHLVVVNRSLRRSLGIAPLEQPPERWLPTLPLTHPDGQPVTPAHMPLLQALAGRQIHGVEQQATTPDGRRRLYSVNAHPITGPDGQRLGAVSVFHDITDRRRAERFRACELAVTLALNQADTVDQATPRVLEAVATTLGWPYAELWLAESNPGGQTLRRIDHYRAPGVDADLPAPTRLTPGHGLAGTACHHTEPLWHTDLANRNSPNTPNSADLRTAVAVPIASGGRTLAVMTLFTTQVEEPQDGLIALLSGIAAHIGQFIERRRAENLQRALSASKNEYLHLVGHELRTPLTVIASYIEMLEDTDPHTTLTQAKPMTAAIRRGSDRLRRLVDALLDLSALDSGHAHLHPEPIDLTDLVATTINQIRPAANAKHLTITTHLPPDLPTIGDRQRLTQMLTAVLDNAITYTPHHGSITIEVNPTGDGADLTIADTGPGIPDTEQPHIFQRFYRGQIATDHAIPGAGLGLPIAQLIAQHHHGHIELIPTPHGTTIRVHLPTQPNR